MEIKTIFESIVQECISKNYSDIHLNSFHKPYIRNISWEIENIEHLIINWETIDTTILTKENIIEIIKLIWTDTLLIKFESIFELDLSYNFHDNTRFRVNCYADSNGFSIAMRRIPSEVPTLEELWLWDNVKQMCQKSKWLILMTWPTGCGKSTNLAAMINYINDNFKKHIITIEDPIEFLIKSKQSLVNQREIWNSTHSFSNAIRACLREDPNVIMVWEMRDAETIKAVITLAETWHLVLSTLHTNDSVQSIDRIIDVFPTWQQDQIKMQLAMSLIWIISQRLLPKIDNSWRIAAREVMVNNDAIRNLIISGKTHQLYSVLEIWQREWMILMDKYLLTLYNKWIISKDILRSYARDKDNIDLI